MEHVIKFLHHLSVKLLNKFVYFLCLFRLPKLDLCRKKCMHFNFYPSLLIYQNFNCWLKTRFNERSIQILSQLRRVYDYIFSVSHQR